MVANVSSLLKTVKSVEDKALRGTRALESTIDAVKQAVLVSTCSSIVKLPIILLTQTSILRLLSTVMVLYQEISLQLIAYLFS